MHRYFDPLVDSMHMESRRVVGMLRQLNQTVDEAVAASLRFQINQTMEAYQFLADQTEEQVALVCLPSIQFVKFMIQEHCSFSGRFYMRSRISIRGCVCRSVRRLVRRSVCGWSVGRSIGRSVRPSVRRSVGRSVRHTRVEFLRNGPNLNKIAPGIR